MLRQKCRKCGGKGFWKVRRGKLKCRSINVIQEETGLSKYKILKALEVARSAMARDIPKKLEGVIEVDETCVGGAWKNKRKSQRKKEPHPKRGRGTNKQPVLGILSRKGEIWVEIVPRNNPYQWDGGIRRERLPVYLVEHAWRNNHQRLKMDQKIKKLLDLVAKI